MSKGMERKYICRFRCNKDYALEWARNNHETKCIKNINKGKKPLFVLIQNKWYYKGGK